MGIVYWSQGVGLANRLRALVGYMAMSEVLEKPFYLCWTPDIYCDASFSELFTCPSGIHLITLQQKELLEQESNISTYTDNIWFDKIWENHLSNSISWPSFSNHINACFQRLRPCSDISKELNLFLNKNNLSHCFGIHIRLTDNAGQYKIWTETVSAFKPSCISKLQGFENFIRDSLQQDSSTKIFLATDNQEIEQKFIQLFPDHIITYPKTFKPEVHRKFSWRNLKFKSQQQRTSSVQDALIEMLLLAKCRCIVGTYFSSFSKLSSFFSDTSLDYFEIHGDSYVKSNYLKKLKGNIPF